MEDKNSPTKKYLSYVWIFLAIINVILFIILITNFGKRSNTSSQIRPVPTGTSTQLISQENPLTFATMQLSASGGLKASGAILLSMSDGDHIHIFAFHPVYLVLTRLTDGPWDDISPAVSPDGTKIAYVSRGNGYWDIYILDLFSKQLTQVTNSTEYEGSPTWSSDGQWLAYEGYHDGNMDIYIQSLVDPNQAVIQLTDDPAMDHSPAWAPGGRQIAFVSTRSGEEEIWLAQLDQVDERFKNLSNSFDSKEKHPSWSPDGRYLAWSSNDGNSDNIYVWDSSDSTSQARKSVIGSWPAWKPGSDGLVTSIENPNSTYLTSYSLSDTQQDFAAYDLPGSIHGLAWLPGGSIAYLETYLTVSNMAAAPALFEPRITLSPAPNNRLGVVPLESVNAPYSFLNDSADEGFISLRKAIGNVSGWDFLANLENAYLPLTEPPEPGMAENWLFSGHAIAVNSLPIQAGWMVVVREDFNGLPYWRVYIRVIRQDGTQGLPIKDMIWDFNPRFQGDPVAYEQGGKLAEAPEGWWVDFTEIALRYGWRRLSSLPSWRTYYPGTRFNQFVLTQDMDWYSAMIELYPPEALATYTPIPTITTTPTRTPWRSPTGTATRTATNTRTPSASPTPSATKN